MCEQQQLIIDFGGDWDHGADTGLFFYTISFYHCGIGAIQRILLLLKS